MSDRDPFDLDEQRLRALFEEIDAPPGVARWRSQPQPLAEAPASGSRRRRPGRAGPLALGRGRAGGAPRRPRGLDGPGGPGRRSRRLRRVLAIAAATCMLALVSLASASALGVRVLGTPTSARGPAPPPTTAAPSPATSATTRPHGAAPPSSAARPATPTTARSNAAPARSWPDGRTTGVPAGTRLTRHDGDLHVTRPGAVVSDLLVTGTVFVEAEGVTIRRSRIVPRAGGYWAVRQLPAAANLTIEDSELAGDGSHDVQHGVRQEAPGLTVRRCDVHHVNAGLTLGRDAEVVDSYVHDLTPPAGAVGVYTAGGTPGITIRHNTVLAPGEGAAAIALYTDAGPQVDVLVDGNLLGGGRVVLFGGAGPGSREVRITRNQVSRERLPKGGADGVVTAWDGAAPGNRWSGNRWHDSGDPIEPG